MIKHFTDTELSNVSKVIADRMGLHFPVEKWATLGCNLAYAAKEFGFGNMSDFIYWYVSSDLTQDQHNLLASHLTVSETYFWREPKVFEALTEYVFPKLFKSRRDQGNMNIRIWSAGCSSGEEAYSLAIALHKSIPGITDWNITILATDINPKVLEKAERGIYGPWSFRNVPDWLKSTYFHNLGNQKYEVISEIKEMVTFSCLNLTKDDLLAEYVFKMDLIFCRNVLMYFTNDWLNKITKNIYSSLADDGWFVVSSSELSSYTFPQYKPVNFPGAILYCKTKNGSISHMPVEVPEIKQSEPIQPVIPLNPFTPFTPFNHSTFQPFIPSTVKPGSPIATTKEDSSTKVNTIEKTSSDFIHLLANEGSLSEALTLCNEAIVSNKLFIGFYFLKASILQEMERIPEAITTLKQAIYINPDNIMVHFTLGNLFIGTGNPSEAKRYFNNVNGLLADYKDDSLLPESEGLSVKYIREIISANIKTMRSR